MDYIKKEVSTTLEIKKSKFIAYITPYSDFHKMMEKLKKERPKARHFVYAYRYLNEFDQVVENSSDDGEPKGTSGKPSLSVLSGANIINTGVIVVRYFGGVKLGTGGLVKAYSDAVNLVLKSSELFPFIKLKNKSLELQYPQLSQIEYLLAQYHITIKSKTFLDMIVLDLEGSNEEFELLSSRLFHDNILKDIN